MEKVLIVDDDAKNIFALSAMLRSKGWETFSASGVNEALQVVTLTPGIKVILLDMMMPDIDGYEGLSVFRQHPLSKQIPVIAVTAQAMKGDREKCMVAGAYDYIPKPVDVDRLLVLLHQITNNGSGNIITE